MRNFESGYQRCPRRSGMRRPEADRMGTAGCTRSLVERMLPARGPYPHFLDGQGSRWRGGGPPGQIIHPIAIGKRRPGWTLDNRVDKPDSYHEPDSQDSSKTNSATRGSDARTLFWDLV